jgi:hypothetical protein
MEGPWLEYENRLKRRSRRATAHQGEAPRSISIVIHLDAFHGRRALIGVGYTGGIWFFGPPCE